MIMLHVAKKFNPFDLSYFGIFNVLNPDLLNSVTNNMNYSNDILDLLIPPKNKRLLGYPFVHCWIYPFTNPLDSGKTVCPGSMA